ncbi:MAG: polysaccharide deacetylase family protein [Defluviitaleaceae bacterium]|nr:polysaccharide deacetylase family protein [Defluviitaleaceae bacterium]
MESKINVDAKGILKTKKPQVALTFDDGPSEHSLRILDTLEKYKARATFFVLGKNFSAKVSAKERQTIKRTFDMGSEVISHSWSHCKNPNLSQLDAEEIKKELLETAEAIRGVVGVSPKMFRPPYGAVSETLRSVADELGLAIILWSLDAWDWRSQNASEIYDEIFSKLHDNAVILCHDVYSSTAEAMERVIPDLLETYELVTVSELMRNTGVTPGAGVIFPQIKNGLV